MKFPNVVTVAQLAGFDEVIDVRSPSEFAEDHVPGAINCPVLDDAERAAIGTMYKQLTPFYAKKRGAAYGHFLGDPQDLKAKLNCLAGLHSKDTYDPAYRRATSKNFEHLAEAQVLRPAKLDSESLTQMAAQLTAEAQA